MKIIRRAIPTFVITGFLGVGKTTAIQSLLCDKPQGERWAILVNEFGEIGVDGGLLTTGADDTNEVFIREVPGGCMCCAAGIPMRVALNQLISKAKPDRLMIEPTGLGHPREVIKALLQPEYHGVIDLQSVVTLVDARKISDTRYTDHPVFRQQLEVADCIVANKADLYVADESEQLGRYLARMGREGTPVYITRHGVLNSAWLQKTNHAPEPIARGGEAGISNGDTLMSPDITLPDAGYLRKTREMDGYHSGGWIFKSDFCFDHEKIYGLLIGLDVERIKAVLHTNKGMIGFNQSGGVLTTIAVGYVSESRLEVITTRPPDWGQLEADLLNCAI